MVRVYLLRGQCFPTARRVFCETLCKAKIENLGIATFGNEDVRWFDVAVDNSLRVCGVQSVRYTNRHFEQGFQFHRAASNCVFQRLTFEKFHCDKRSAVLSADVVYGADVWMVERRCCLRLSLKARQRLWVLRYIVREELQCHETMQPCVLGLVNHTHPAPAQLLDNAVVGDGLADEGVGVRHGGDILGCSPWQVNESRQSSSLATMFFNHRACVLVLS